MRPRRRPGAARLVEEPRQPFPLVHSHRPLTHTQALLIHSQTGNRKSGPTLGAPLLAPAGPPPRPANDKSVEVSRSLMEGGESTLGLDLDEEEVVDVHGGRSGGVLGPGAEVVVGAAGVGGDAAGDVEAAAPERRRLHAPAPLRRVDDARLRGGAAVPASRPPSVLPSAGSLATNRLALGEVALEEATFRLRSSRGSYCCRNSARSGSRSVAIWTGPTPSPRPISKDSFGTASGWSSRCGPAPPASSGNGNSASNSATPFSIQDSGSK